MTNKNSKINLPILLFALSFFFFVTPIANAATLYFSPSSGNFTVGNIFTVNVLVNTENATINNAEATLNFPSGLLEIVSFSKSGSIFSLWVEEPSFSNGAGTLSFNGGLPTPGFNGATGKVISVVFRVKKAGSATVVFTSPAVRANDGYGTNVFRVGVQASYNLIAEVKSEPSPTPIIGPTPAPISTTAIPRPIITSATHPNESAWYPGNNPLFKWDVPDGVTEVLLILSRNSGSVPTIRYSPPISERSLTEIGEGTWYFNARFRTASGLGPVTSFRINIDTQPPRNFTLVRLDPDDTTNPRPLLLFESADNTSGIEKYQMKIGTGDWFDIEPNLAGRPFAIPLQRFGDYLVQVKALDFAGNSASSNTEIAIAPVPIPPPIIKDVILPKTETDKVTIIKEEVEVVVKEVVVKEVVVKEVVVKGKVIKEGVPVKVAAVVVNVLKLEGVNGFGQISGALKDTGLKLVKTVEIPVDEAGKFEAKVDNLDSGTYIIRTYGKDERGAISDAYSDVVLKVASESFVIQFAKWVSNAIMRSFDFIVNLLSNGGLLIAFLAVLIGLLISVIKLFERKIRAYLRAIRQKIILIATKNKSLNKLDHIIEDMKAELKFLESIGHRRKLNPEENYLKNKMVQYLKILENIKDVEDKS